MPLCQEKQAGAPEHPLLDAGVLDAPASTAAGTLPAANKQQQGQVPLQDQVSGAHDTWS
jgi:hypothetical protein